MLGLHKLFPEMFYEKCRELLLLLQPGTILGSHGPRILRDV